MKKLWWMLLLAGCGHSEVNDRLRQQWRGLTQGPPAFSSAGDATAMSPTPDNGFFGSESTTDCSGCPPR